MKAKIIFPLVIVAVIVLLIVFWRGSITPSIDKEPSSPFQGWPPEDNYKCNSDLDCVSLSCPNIGNLVTHKNALKYLDEFKEKFCDPVISNENVLCFRTLGSENYPYYNKCIINQENYVNPDSNLTDNLTQPGLPPDARQPFSDD